MVAMAAPPQKGAESIQIGRYLKYLTEKFNIELVTANTPTRGWLAADSTLAKDGRVQHRVTIKSYSRGWLTKLHRIAGRPAAEERFAESDRQVINRLQLRPDLIYSRALPHASTLLAARLKAHFRVPWVLHLSDPWADSAFVTTNRQVHQLEKSCLAQADRITLTSEPTVRFYKEKYPELAGKFIFMPNVHDAPAPVPRTAAPAGKITIVHTGNFYGRRNPEALLTVLKSLNKEGCRNGPEFIFAGEADDYTRKLFRHFNLPQVTYLGSLTLADSLQLQQQSDVLLVIDKPYEKPTDLLPLPSKLLDYCATGKPILALSPENSATTQFIEKHRLGLCFDYNRLLELKTLLHQLDSHHSLFNQQPIWPEKYNSRYNAKRQIKIFNKLVT